MLMAPMLIHFHKRNSLQDAQLLRVQRGTKKTKSKGCRIIVVLYQKAPLHTEITALPPSSFAWRTKQRISCVTLLSYKHTKWLGQGSPNSNSFDEGFFFHVISIGLIIRLLYPGHNQFIFQYITSDFAWESISCFGPRQSAFTHCLE